MITSSNVKDYLKSKIDGVDRWYSGSLRSNDVKGICVYSKPSMGTNKVCVGGFCKEKIGRVELGPCRAKHFSGAGK